MLCATGYSQELKIDDYVRLLSVKTDIGAANREQVYNELIKLDSIQRCSIIRTLTERSNGSNVRFRIRLDMLRLSLAYVVVTCPDNPPYRSTLEADLNKTYEMGDHLLAAELNQMLSLYFFGTGEQTMSAMYNLIGRDLRREVGEDNFRNVALDLYLLGDLLYKMGDYNESLKVTEQSVNYHGRKEVNKMDSLNIYWKMNAWNSIGLCYKWLGNYDSAFVALNHAFLLAKSPGIIPFWAGLIQGNRGDVFFLQEKYDSAEVLLKLDYEQSLVSHEYDNAAMSLQRLARIENSRGEHQLALKMIKEADQLERRMANPDYRVSILYAYALVYRDLGMADSAFAYMQEYHDKMTASEKIGAKNRAEILGLMLNNQKNVNRIRELSKEKDRIKLIRNFVMILTLLFTAFGFLYLNRQRLRLKLRQQQAIEKERLANAEAQLAKDQLDIFTQRILEKTSLVEKLQDQLMQKELNETQVQYINELSNHTILTDQDWEEFKSLFEKVFPGFFIHLKSQSPDITLAEQRIAALIKLRVDSKEAATLLGVSPNTISKSRQRLRQRLGLDPDADLEAYFSGKIV